MRSPLVRTPVRLSGSTALIVMQPAVAPALANLAQTLHRLRQRELLAGHARHETAAANFAPGFQPPVDGGQRAPGRGVDLTRQKPAEHHAVPDEQRPGLRLDGGLSIRVRQGKPHRRPAPGAILSARLWAGAASCASPPERRRIHRRRPGPRRRGRRWPRGRSASSIPQALTSSLRNDGPRARSALRTSRAPSVRWRSSDSTWLADRRNAASARRRRARAETARRARRRSGPARSGPPAGLSRAQPISPVRHSMSSHAASYRSSRAGSTARSQAPAGSSTPSSMERMVRAPSMPDS